ARLGGRCSQWHRFEQVTGWPPSWEAPLWRRGRTGRVPVWESCGREPPARPYGPRTDWELVRQSALAEPEFEGLSEGEYFTVQFGHVPAGHERVTELAGRGLPCLDLKALVAGVRS